MSSAQPAAKHVSVASAAAAPSLKLDEQLCFALYAASRTVTQAYRPLLDALSLTYPQYLVMLVLWEFESATVGELGTRLYLDSGTLTPLLKRLEKAGFVTRRRADHDERTVIVALTREGKALHKAASRVPSAIACQFSLDPAQAADLRDRLKAITAELTTEKS